MLQLNTNKLSASRLSVIRKPESNVVFNCLVELTWFMKGIHFLVTIPASTSLYSFKNSGPTFGKVNREVFHFSFPLNNRLILSYYVVRHHAFLNVQDIEVWSRSWN